MEKSILQIRPGGRIRLLWLIDSLTVGGAERLVTTFAKHLDRDRYDLIVVCLKSISGNPMAVTLEEMGVKVKVLHAKNLRDVRTFFQLLSFIRNKHIDIIHTHLTYADIWGRLAGWITKTKVVSTIHVPRFFNYLNPRFRDRIIERLAMMARKHIGDITLSVSNALGRVHVSHGFPEARLKTVYNGIDLSRFNATYADSRNKIRQNLGISLEAPLVITVSVLREGKGHDILLSAAEQVVARVPKVTFLIVGSGPLEDSLKKRVQQSILKDHVVFTGNRNDIPELLASADLFALPSYDDPLPTVTLEAMALQLPVVGFISGGIPEMVQDGHTGLLAPASDESAFAKNISELLLQPVTCKEMGEAGYHRVCEVFSAQRWAHNLQNIYERILKKKIHVVEFPERGGMIHYAYQLCSGLSSQGYDVSLITGQAYELSELPHNFSVKKILRLWDPKKNDSSSRMYRLVRRLWRALKYYYSWILLIRYLRRVRPDIVQFGEIRFPLDLVPLMLLRMSGLTLTDICHNVSPFDVSSDNSRLIKASWWYTFMYRMIYKCFSIIFLHAEESRKTFLELYGGKAEKLHIIPHGNENLFVNYPGSSQKQVDLRTTWQIPKGTPVALFFGTVSKYKGVEDLIQAFPLVRERIPQARLVIAGFPNADTDPHVLCKQVEESGLTDAIIFHLEYIENKDVAAFFTLADVVVYPYRMIYQSGAIQLAYSFGKPVVATRVGGLPDVVTHNKTGFLVPPHDTAALGEAISILLGDVALAKRLGEQAKGESNTRYSWNTIAQTIQEVYTCHHLK